MITAGIYDRRNGVQPSFCVRQQYSGSNVRFGSLADILGDLRDVRFTPESGDAIGMSALCQQQPLPSSLRSLSALWSAQSEITLGAEDVAVKACNPLPPPRGHIQVLNGGLDMRRNSFPIKLRV